MDQMDEYDIIVIGAGIAGSAAAFRLGCQGYRVLLIERDWKEPDRIVGELLQPGGIKALRDLGLEDTVKDIDGIQVHGYTVIKPTTNESILLPYPCHFQPAMGISFHHGRFIMKLREAAKSVPTVTPVEATASELLRCPNTDRIIGVKVSQKQANEELVSRNFFAPLTIVADGCFSKFRKEFIDLKPEVKSYFVGLVLKDCPLPQPNFGHVILADPSPILLYQIGTHDTRILVDIPDQVPSIGNGSMQKYLREFVGPQLPKAVQASFYEAVEEQRARSMPNSWLPPTCNRSEGVYVIGDAMNMRHPLTGGGMTVALSDVVQLTNALAPKSLASFTSPTINMLSWDMPRKENSSVPVKPTLESPLQLVPSKTLSQHLSRLHWNRKPLASVVNILANALYALFSSRGNKEMKALQNACFRYLGLGGSCTNTPIGLLAGMITEPLTLVVHFFAVAFYAMYLICLDSPMFFLPVTLLQSLWTVIRAAWVILPLIAAELRG